MSQKENSIKCGRQVPAYGVKSYSGKRSPYCVIVFVLNEGARIRAQLSKMRAYASAADIVIADGGSSDGALDESYLRGQGVRALLTKTGPGKLSAQMRMGFAYALGEGYEGVITMDGNDKDDPSAIPRFAEALREGYDHVQGSRFIRGGEALRTPPVRLWAIRMIHAPMVSLAAGFRYTDTTNGFRAYSRRLLEDVRADIFRDIFSEYELHYYLAIRAVQLGWKVCEIPVRRIYPEDGSVPSKIHSWRSMASLLNQLILVCAGQYHPKKGKAS